MGTPLAAKDIELHQINLPYPDNSGHGRSVLFQSISPDKDSSEVTLFVFPNVSDDSIVAAAKGARKAEVQIDFMRAPYVDIRKITIEPGLSKEVPWCSSDTWEGDEIKKKVLNKDLRVMRIALMQDRLGDLVFRGNEVVGNIVFALVMIRK